MTYGAKKDSAIEHYEKALKLFPESPIAHIEYGNGLIMLFGKGKIAEATKLYEKAAALQARRRDGAPRRRAREVGARIAGGRREAFAGRTSCRSVTVGCPPCWRRAASARCRRAPRTRAPRREARGRAAAAAAPVAIDTLKRIRDTSTILIGVRESSVPFSFLDAQKQPQGYSVDLCAARGRRGQGRAQGAEARRQVRAGDVVQPHPGAARRQDRPRVRLHHQHARPPEAGRVRVHDVRRGHQDAREEVVERELDRRTCAARASS